MIFTQQLILQKILQKIKFRFCIYLAFFCFAASFAFANKNIIINGNKNISEKTIQSLAPINIDTLNPNVINDYQKKLFETGFFEEVLISIKEKKIIINLKENPLVNFFFIEGIKNNELKDKIIDIAKIKENTIFQPYLIKQDIKNISNLLKDIGYLNNKVNYKLIKIDDNKINLFYKIDLENKFKIKRIFFIGNKYFKSSTLSDVVHSSEHGWWKFLSSSTTPSESLINYDISKLKSFYLNKGFYDVQINSHSIKLIDDRYANIIYSIDSGKKYLFGKVQLVDNSKSLSKANISYLEKKYNKLTNKFFDKSEIDKLFDLSNEYLIKSNYNLIVQREIIKNNINRVDLKFIISNQPNQKIIDKIIIVGNSITDDFVIRNNLNFSEGDNFVDNKLFSSVEKLKGTGLFKNVLSETRTNNENKIDLEIKVEEQPTGEISAGAGAGTNGATISAGINERNFLGKGIIINSNINLGTQKIFGSVNYSNPDYKNSGNTLNTSIFIESNDYDNASYQNKVIGSSISTKYEIYENFFLSPGIAADFDSVNANSDASSLIKRREGDYYTTKIFYDLSKNTKNRDLMPTEGYTFGVGQGLSFLSDIPYINNRIFGSYYNEYKENFVGSIKYKIESINGFDDDIKFSDRLFVSSNVLRGFSSRGIGPKIDNDFIGGNYSYYTTVSSTIPNGLPEKWNAATNIFFDSANVWGVDDNSTGDSNKIRTSIGIGLSWVSPLGPISITYAEPITKETTDDVEQFNFKIGSAF